MYIHTVEGEGPVVLTVPHDGGIMIPGAPTRVETTKWQSDGGPDPRDLGTMDLAIMISRQMQRRFVPSPTILSCFLHRSHVDVNRDRKKNPYAEGFGQVYQDFHVELQRQIGRVQRLFGYWLVLDLHSWPTGYGPDEFEVILGTDRFKTWDETWAKSFANFLSASHRTTFSPNKKAGINGKFRGGWIVRSAANKKDNKSFGACQIEVNGEIRADSPRLSYLAERITSAILEASHIPF